jgi:hypothetical protein
MGKVLLISCICISCTFLALQDGTSVGNNSPKDISIPNIIQSFAQKETEFHSAYERYSYTREVKVAADCPNGVPGLYLLVVDVGLDRNGKRTEAVLQEKNLRLHCLGLTKEDIDHFRDLSLFVLTTEEIKNYRINFVGQEQEGGLSCYVFDVSPAIPIPEKKFFEGRIWVNSQDFAIVKTQGNTGMKLEKKQTEQENVFPVTTTWRKPIDGYWFPTLSRANEVLHFPKGGDLHLNEEIEFTSYKAKVQPK